MPVVAGNDGLVLPASNAAIALADYDRDGRIDLYVARTNLSHGDSWLEGYRATRCPTSSGTTRGTGSSATSPERAARTGAAARPSRPSGSTPTRTAGPTSTSSTSSATASCLSISRTAPSRDGRSADGPATSARWGSPAATSTTTATSTSTSQHVLQGRQPGHRQPLAGACIPSPILAKLRSFVDRQPVAPQPGRT